MAQTASDSTLSFVFGEAPKVDDGLCDPFEESCSADAGVKVAGKARQPSARRKKVAVQPGLMDGADDDPGAATYTFRWDVEVPLEDRAKCGPKFMKQWKRVLQAQKLTPLVSMKLPLHEARFQLCVIGNGEATLVAAHEREIAEELSRLRRDASHIAGEPAGTHPAGWQGVRVWMTFARRDVETALAKKPRV
ncbi:MAG: hypothetical protein H7145_23325 [Akkermansiaceae bacterium]|nr:hypothetical protein [Armatimonadota bacterium]